MAALRNGEISKKRKVVGLMLEGCWRSCISPDPDTHLPFVANAIIANPVSFAHVHCAQAVGVPLHIMFTMPWTATGAFPHPLANIKASDVGTGPANYWSYHLVSLLTWQGLADVINSFRQHTLSLEPIPLTEGAQLLQTLEIPHTYFWSSALIPKPDDWPRHIDVAGFIFRQAPDYKPSVELSEFLGADPSPIYVGFGSIVVDDPETLTAVLLRAIELSGVRAVISPGWSSLKSQQTSSSDDVFFLEGDCPHEWLFRRVSTVVHHGGAGTTACGLRNSQPTVIVPFFGDQLFWGDMIAKAGAGPRPIPRKALTAENLAEAIQFCMKPDARKATRDIAARMQHEDGVQEAVASFHRHLSTDAIACDILPEWPAAWTCQADGKTVKLSIQAAEILIDGGLAKAKNLGQ
jgi:UDP:flavonoid glycosyltransferase YjiC (YdhE family)